MRRTLKKLAFLSSAFVLSAGLGVLLSNPRPAQASTTCTGGPRTCNDFITSCEQGGGTITPGCFDATTGIPTCFTCSLD